MQLVSYVTINKEANRTTRDSGYRQRARALLPSSSLTLCEAPLLSTFRGAGSAQADEYGHVPISSESTERETEGKTERNKRVTEKNREGLKGKETHKDPGGMIEIRTTVNI